MSIFPTRVLLATDGSTDADLALSTAVDIANSTNSELHVVTVGPGSPDPAYAAYESGFRYESYEEALEEIRQEAQGVLDRADKEGRGGWRHRRGCAPPDARAERPGDRQAQRGVGRRTDRHGEPGARRFEASPNGERRR